MAAMKIAAHLFAVLLITVALISSACNYIKPVMYINLSNSSGHAMRNVELTHPTGTFGLPELRNGQTHQHMAPIGTPCKFKVKFEDEAGKKYSTDYDLGTKCPTEIAFEVGEGMKVSERQLRP
jgi:hypothetical protein